MDLILEKVHEAEEKNMLLDDIRKVNKVRKTLALEERLRRHNSHGISC